MSIQTLSETLHYDGKIKLIYNESNPKIRYQTSHLKPDGTWTQPTIIAGVSSVLSTIPKPYLVAWAGLSATEKAVELLDKQRLEDVRKYVTEYIEKYETTAYEAIKAGRKRFPFLAEIATGHTTKSNQAKDEGTDAHDALEAFILGKEYTPTTEGGKNALESFKKSSIGINNPKTEQVVLSRQHSYAGRFDLLCEIGGKLVLADWKTNKRDARYNPSGARLENFIQMGAYAFAWWEEHGQYPDDLAVINVDKIEGKPAIITYASDFGASVQELASDFLSRKGVSDSLRQLEYKWGLERL